jgi:hypothetical protein
MAGPEPAIQLSIKRHSCRSLKLAALVAQIGPLDRFALLSQVAPQGWAGVNPAAMVLKICA